MTLRTRMLTLADRVRRIPVALDERPTSVTIRTIVSTGGRVGAEGPKTTTDLVLAPTPKTRWVNGRDIAASGGRYSVGDVKVGPITPSYAGGGYTEAQLAPTANQNGVKIVYVLTGNITGEFERLDLDTGRSHSWFLTLRRRRSTP